MSVAKTPVSPQAFVSRLLAPETLAPAFAVLLTLFAYLRSLGGGFVFDDNQIIVTNPMIERWSFLWNAFSHDFWYFAPKGAPMSPYFRPLENVWLSINFHLFGLNPFGWHAGVVLLHLLAVWLLYRFAVRLGLTAWSAAIAATLFGVAPLHAAAISWVAALSYPMTASFELAALLAFTNRHFSARRRFGLSLAGYACALLSHESAIFFPALIAAYTFLLGPGASESPAFRTRRALEAAAPFVALGLIYLAVRVSVLGFITRLAEHRATPAQAVFSLPSVLCHYLAIVVAPWIAGPAHQIDLVSGPATVGFWVPVAGLLALAAALYGLLSSHPHRNLYLFLFVWVAAAMAPVLNLRLPLGDSMVEDRYLYLPSIAVFIFITDVGAGIGSSFAKARWLPGVLAAAVIPVYAALLWHVQWYWHDEVTLMRKCLEVVPGSWVYHDRLAMRLMDSHDLAGAEAEFTTALEAYPDDPNALMNLATVEKDLGRTDDATNHLWRALEVLSKLGSNSAGIFVSIAETADMLGASDLRDAALEQAESCPDSARPIAVGRASMMILRHDYADAEAVLRASVQQDPDSVNEWTLLAVALERQDRIQEAIDMYEKALALAPDPKMQQVIETKVSALESIERGQPASTH